MHCGIHKAGGSVGEICRRRKNDHSAWLLQLGAWVVVLSAVSGTYVWHVVYHISEDTAHGPHLYILRGTSIGTSPCGTRGLAVGVCYSNWNVLPRLTRASIMFLCRPQLARTSYQLRNFASCAPRYIQLCGIHPTTSYI